MNKIAKRNFNRDLRKKRSRAKVSGTAEKPRLVVFRSNKYTYAQLIDDSQGRTLAAASTKDLKRGQKKTEAAKAIGELLGKKAKELGIKNATFHRSAYKFHGRVKAVAEGARGAGLKL